MSEEAKAICEGMLVWQANKSNIDLNKLRDSAGVEAMRSIKKDLKEGYKDHPEAKKIIRNWAARLAGDVWEDLRRDLAPVWEKPDPQRVERLRSMIETLKACPPHAEKASEFERMLHAARYLELVVAMLRWLCEYSQRLQNVFDRRRKWMRDRRAATEVMLKYAESETRKKDIARTRLTYAAAELAQEMSKPLWFPFSAPTKTWTFFPPLYAEDIELERGGKATKTMVFTPANAKESEAFAPFLSGRKHEWIKSKLCEALMNVLLVAGYDKGERNNKPLNKHTAADRALRIAAKDGIELSADALERAKPKF